MRGARSQHPQDRANFAVERSPVALLLLDVINDLEWEGGEALVNPFSRIAPAIAELSDQARASGVPVIYVNDNYGRWGVLTCAPLWTTACTRRYEGGGSSNSCSRSRTTTSS